MSKIKELSKNISESKYSYGRQHDEVAKNITSGAKMKNIDSRFSQPSFKFHFHYWVCSLNSLVTMFSSVIWEY